MTVRNEPPIRLILLGTEGCHLCEEAEIIINEVLDHCSERVDVEKIDISEQEKWQEKYAVRIPVLYHLASQLELGWPFNQTTLYKFLIELRQ